MVRAENKARLCGILYRLSIPEVLVLSGPYLSFETVRLTFRMRPYAPGSVSPEPTLVKRSNAVLQLQQPANVRFGEIESNGELYACGARFFLVTDT